MRDLEGEKPPEEVVKPTSDEKGEKPTKPEEKPTVGITETEEFRQALDKALGKSTASLQQQVTLSKQAAEVAKAEAESHRVEAERHKTYIEALKREVDEALVDDPEKRQAYISRIASLEREQSLADREAKAAKESEIAALDAMSAILQRRAIELSKETGIELTELDGLDEVSMVEKAFRFKVSKEPAKEQEKESKFDSGVSSGGGGDWRGLSPDEKLTRGLSQKK